MEKKSIKTNITISMWPIFAILVILKVFGYINWSWIWIFSPLWGPFAIFFIGIALYFLISIFTDNYGKYY